MPNYSDPTLSVASAAVILPAKVTIGQLLVLVAGALAVVVAGFLYIQIIQANNQVASDTAKSATITSQIAAKQSVVTTLTYYNSVGTGMKQLFDNQILWSPTLAKLEAHLYKHMVISTLQISSKGQVTLSGYTPNYTDYAEVYSSFTDSSVGQYFSNVRPITVTKDPKVGQINFAFTFTLSPTEIVTASAQ